MQDLESESLLMGGEHPQEVKAPPSKEKVKKGQKKGQASQYHSSNCDTVRPDLFFDPFFAPFLYAMGEAAICKALPASAMREQTEAILKLTKVVEKMSLSTGTN